MRQSAYNQRVWNAATRKQILGYVVAVIVIAAATAVLKFFGVHINPTTVALALLLIVLFVPSRGDRNPRFWQRSWAVSASTFSSSLPLAHFILQILKIG